MEPSDVTSPNMLEAYLTRLRSVEQAKTAQFIAFRQAARSAPKAFQHVLESQNSGVEGASVIPIFASLLVPSIGFHVGSMDLQEQSGEVHRAIQRLIESYPGDAISEVELARLAVNVATSALVTYAGARDEGAVRDTINLVAFAEDASILKWREVQDDLKFFRIGRTHVALWAPTRVPSDVKRSWDKVKARLLNEHADENWDFWITWFERVQNGVEIHADYLLNVFRGIADSEIWLGDAKHLNSRFAGIQAVYLAEERQAAERETVDQKSAFTNTFMETKAGMIRHRRELPATFDAILGYISIEVGNLQERNDNRDLVDRQIDVLLTLHQAIEKLHKLVPTRDQLSDSAVKEADGMLRLIVNRAKTYSELEREDGRTNLEAMVDSTIEGGLEIIGKSAKFGIYGGIGCVLMSIFGAGVTAGIMGVAFGKDAMAAGKQVFNSDVSK